jgi:hypothetical protein
MAADPNIGRKARIFAMIGIGIAALVGAYQFATTVPLEGGSAIPMPVIFIIVAVVCFGAAALMARKLKGTSSK